MAPVPLAMGSCPLCGRDMVAGSSVNRHHLLPKCKGGRETVLMHRVCHRKIHSLFSEKELESSYATADALLEHPDIKAFVLWLVGKPAEFYVSSSTSKRKGR